MNRIVRITATIIAGAFFFLVFPTASPADATPYRWEESVVYVENHASAKWQVRRAANNLSKGSSLTLRVVGQCPPDKPCVRVYDVHNIPGTTIGRTSSWSSNGHTTRADVYLENSWAKKANRKQRRGLTCHELGHAVGLPHSSSGNTCMKQGAWRVRPAHISKKERRILDRWY